MATSAPPFSAVYVDRRAVRERVEFRSETTPDVSTQLLSSASSNGTFDKEHVEVAENVRKLLSSFGSGRWNLSLFWQAAKGLGLLMLTLPG